MRPISDLDLGKVTGGLFGGALLRGLGKGLAGAGKLASSALQSGAVGDIIRASTGGGGGGGAAAAAGGAPASLPASAPSAGGGTTTTDLGGGTSVSVSVRIG